MQKQFIGKMRNRKANNNKYYSEDFSRVNKIDIWQIFSLSSKYNVYKWVI